MKKFKKIFFSAFLLFFILSAISCGSIGKDGEPGISCGGIDFEESWFYDWERTVACAQFLDKKNYDEYLVQRLHFISGEIYFLRNEMKKAKKSFFSSLEGPDCLVRGGSLYYLKKTELAENESQIIKHKEESCSAEESEISLFDRYLHLLSVSVKGGKGSNLDKFYDLYSMVLGSVPVPLLFNIAVIAIEEEKHGQGYPLLKNITDRYPGFIKAEELKKKVKMND